MDRSTAGWFMYINNHCPSCGYLNGSTYKPDLLTQNIDVVCTKCNQRFSMCADEVGKNKIKKLIALVAKESALTHELNHVREVLQQMAEVE